MHTHKLLEAAITAVTTHTASTQEAIKLAGKLPPKTMLDWQQADARHSAALQKLCELVFQEPHED